jgi:hypothetical protein
MKLAHMTDYRVITVGILRQNAQISQNKLRRVLTVPPEPFPTVCKTYAPSKT